MTKETKDIGVRLLVTQYADAVTASDAAWERVGQLKTPGDALLVARMLDEHREEIYRQMIRLAKASVDGGL